MLAAVMPLPNDDVTPPVTKTYFATDFPCSGWFSRCYRIAGPGATRHTAHRSGHAGMTGRASV